MAALPVGYRIVGGLSIASAVLMGSFLTLLIATPHPSTPGNATESFATVTFVLSPLALFLGGILLLVAQRPTIIRVTAWLTSIAGVVLLLKALLVTIVVFQAVSHSRNSTGVLGFVLLPLIVMPASIWGVVVLLTGILLDRRRRGPL